VAEILSPRTKKFGTRAARDHALRRAAHGSFHASAGSNFLPEE